MYFVNNVQLDLSVLSPYLPEERQKRNPDEVESMIKSKWKELHDKYSREKLTFVCPAIKSGIGMGNMGGAFDRSVVIQTETGTKVIVWCDIAIPNGNGSFQFRPIKYKHTPETKSKTLDLQKDIEEILWLTLFDPYSKQDFTFPAKDETGAPHPLAGRKVKKVYLLDRNEEAEQFLTESSRDADMKFYLTSPRSPIIKNRELILTLASAWGVIKPENKTDAVVRMELMQAIDNNEKQHNDEWGYDGFCEKVSSMIESGVDEKTETMAFISMAVDRNIIKYSVQKLTWTLLNESGVEIKRICGVPPLEATKPKEVLCRHLMNNSEDMAIIQGSVDSKPLYKKQPLRVYIPRNPTEAWFREDMEFPKMKTACNIIGYDPIGKKKSQLVEVLIDHFVTKKQWIDDENLLDKP